MIQNRPFEKRHGPLHSQSKSQGEVDLQQSYHQEMTNQQLLLESTKHFGLK